jgi:uncharacterized membrane protein
METKHVGYLMIAVSVLIGFITYIFNSALTGIVNASCSHGQACPMWGTIDAQTQVALGITAFIFIIGAYLAFFFREGSAVPMQKPTREQFAGVMKILSHDENAILEKLIEAEGAMFQSDLVEKAGMQKVKVTRLLDRLEGLKLIERKRRGMTNVVILKAPQHKA